MTVRQYQNCYQINKSIIDDIEKMALIVCEVYNMTPDKVDAMKPKKFVKLVSKIGKVFKANYAKPFYANLRLNIDATQLTLGKFIECQFWLKQDAVEVLHLIAASITKKKKQHKKFAEKVLDKPIEYVMNDVLAFIESLNKLLQSYKGLFEIEETIEDELNQYDKQEKLKQHPFIERYGWIYSAKQVAEHNSISINDAYKLPIIQALNDLSFLKSKQDYENKMSK